MADNVESLSIRDLLNTLISRLTGIEGATKELRDDLRDTRKCQVEIEKHLAQINGTMEDHERSIRSHSGELKDHGGLLSSLLADVRTVMAVSKVRDEHLHEGVRDARATGLEMRDRLADAALFIAKVIVAIVIAGLLFTAVAALMLVAVAG